MTLGLLIIATLLAILPSYHAADTAERAADAD